MVENFTEKDIFKNSILTRMKYVISSDELFVLDKVLSENLYDVEVVKQTTLPDTIDNSNSYILDLYETKRGMTLKPGTIKEYMVTANEFVRYIPKPLINVQKDDVEYYLRMKQKEQTTNVTLNNKRKMLNSLFTWMVKNHFRTDNPMDDIPFFKEVSKPVDYLTAVEMEQLKTGCRTKKDRALLEWLRSTAMRRGEISDVRINQIDWNTGKVMIYGSKTDTYRLVILDSIAMKYLKEYIIEERGLNINSNQPIFTRSRGDKTVAISSSGLYAEIKNIAKRSGLNRRIYPHLFRKTCCTNIIRRGGSVDDAGIYLGHKPSGVTSKHYIYTSDHSVQRIFENYVETI